MTHKLVYGSNVRPSPVIKPKDQFDVFLIGCVLYIGNELFVSLSLSEELELHPRKLTLKS